MPAMIKCRYKYCERLHISRSLPKEEAAKHGVSTYYHPDCLDYSKTINEIKDLFYNKVNRNVVIPQLVRNITDIVFNKKVDPHFLKYALECAIAKGIINYPGGLYYIIGDKKLMEQWKKMNAPAIKEDSFVDEDEFDFDDVGFDYTTDQQTSFADVLV